MISVLITNAKMKLYAFHLVAVITIHAVVRMVFTVLIAKKVYYSFIILFYNNQSNLILYFNKEYNECQIEVNGVVKSPCQNNGTCYDLVDAYYCEYL